MAGDITRKKQKTVSCFYFIECNLIIYAWNN